MNKFFGQLAAIDIPRILIVGLGVTVFYWFTLYDDGSSLDGQIASAAQLVAEEEQKKADTDATLRQVQEMQEKIGQLSSKYQEISRRLPSALFSIDINKAIDEFARASGVSVKSKKPGEPIKREVVEEVPVQVSLEGTFAELAQFTFLVASAERISRVTDITITNTELGGKKLKYDGDVIGYKLAPEPPKPPPETVNPDEVPPPPPEANQ